MQKYPEPIVGAFIFNKKGQTLLVQSHKWKDKAWHVCGGHIELGETIKQACSREVKEEVGLKINFIKVFQIQEAVFPPNFSRKKHFIFFECKCIAENDIVKIDNDEISRAEWFDIEEIKNLNIEGFTKKAIEKLVENGCK